jgi:hypothetical protein
MLAIASALVRLGLEERHGEGLRGGADLHPERVVNAPPATPARLPVHGLDGPGRLLAADQVLGPPAGVERRVDQLRAGVCLVEGHHRSSIAIE